MRPQLPINAPNPRTYLRHAPVLERLMFRTSETPSGCWLWRGYVNADGYGQIGLGGDGGAVVGAHRAAYESLVGPIPEGMTIDHLCRVRNCVRPDHLEAVPLPVNIVRGWDARRADGLCRNGHQQTSDNTIPNGKNRCRECARARNRAYKARLRSAVA